MIMILIFLLVGTFLRILFIPPNVHSTCEISDSSGVPRCSDVSDVSDNVRKNKMNEMIVRTTGYRVCYVPVSFTKEKIVEVKTSGGNLTNPGHIFAERLTNINDCSQQVFSLMKVDNVGCQREILQNTTINLYLQTSVTVQVHMMTPDPDKYIDNTSCSNSVRTYDKFIQCNLTSFEELGPNEFLNCNVPCNHECNCILSDREFTSVCDTTRENVTNILLVYPYPSKFIKFAHMNLSSLEENTFTSFLSLLPKEKIKKLYLNNNRLTELPNGLFLGHEDIYFLNLSSNYLERLQPNVFLGLSGLSQMFLDFNNISYLENGVFNGLTKLNKLDITDNNLINLQANLFSPAVNLEVLRIRNNAIHYLHPGFLSNMYALREIDLSSNKIHELKEGVFIGAENLRLLYLHSNNLEKIGRGAFKDTTDLKVLYIYGEFNTLIRANRESFLGITNDTEVLVQKAAICCFIPQTQMCNTRNPDSAFLTCARLLPNEVLRVFMWILGICAFVGNILVLYWRYTRNVRENPVQSFLITNLSISDLLMGIYMLIIASADLYFGNNFTPQADQWRNGFTCQFSGFLAMVSSEASVFFVTLISVDRLFRIKYTFSRFTLREKSSYIITSGLWVISIVIGIVAIILSVVNPDLYTMSEVCIGLPLVRKYITEIEQVMIGKKYRRVSKIISSEPQMFFSMAIFFGLNLLCFMIVAICYLQIFITVKKSSRKSGGKSDKEVKLAIKMAVIIWTDFCCWVPIAILGILAQAGQITIHPTVYAWIVTFILPINSSVNPFLYTIATLSTERLRHRLSTLGDTITGIGIMRTSL